MRIPVIHGVIDRRVLVNYRVDPAALSKLLPDPFRPQVVDGYGVAGICLIRLTQLRPRILPAICGVSSENAAHRIAVEWDTKSGLRTGVYVPRRDSSSWLNAMAGGRLFPGVHHRARFDVRESQQQYHVAMTSVDGSAHVSVDGVVSEEYPADSIFGSLQEASDFFAQGSLGYSPRKTHGTFDGMELCTDNWAVEPLRVTRVESSFFNDPSRLPAGSVEFDNALLMRGIAHQWRSREALCCPSVPTVSQR